MNMRITEYTDTPLAPLNCVVDVRDVSHTHNTTPISSLKGRPGRFIVLMNPTSTCHSWVYEQYMKSSTHKTSPLKNFSKKVHKGA